jgi:hypothetical protein
MKNQIYQNSKQLLISIAKEAKRLNGNDKPMIREIINNNADAIRRQINFYAMKETISEKQAAMYCNWIDALACNLHPN